MSASPTARLFSDIDTMDAKLFASHLSEDGVLRFANAPVVEGREAIEEAIAGFFTTLKALRHELVDQWDVDGATIVEVEVTYTRLDGDQVTLPAVVIMRRSGDGEQIDDYRIFIDQGPLYT
jgi:ketosteroid isomerase-like protein